MKRALCTCALCLLLLGCGAGRTFGVTTIAGRDAVVHRGAGLPAGRHVPLVLVLHGRDQHPGQIERITGFDALADRYGFESAYPSSGAKPNWNSGPHAPRYDRVYLGRFIRALRARGGIDPRRVYVVGFSAGGSMAYQAGCELSGLVAGIGAVKAVMGEPTCRPRHPMTVLTIAGTKDPEVPFGGTARIASPRATSARWARLAHCRRRPGSSSSGAVTVQTWSRCRGRSRVRLDVIEGGVHLWPGGMGVDGASPDGQLDASRALWRFLSRASTGRPRRG